MNCSLPENSTGNSTFLISHLESMKEVIQQNNPECLDSSGLSVAANTLLK